MMWEYNKLGNILQIQRGGSPRPIDKYLTNDENGINWIKISDATASDKYIFKTKQKISEDGLHKTRLVYEDDFLLSNSMSFGRPYIMKTTGCIHDGWLVLRQKEHKIFDINFLYYLLSSPIVFNQFDSLAAGSTVRNLNISLVSSVEVPIPSLSEQQDIVEKLDFAFDAIEKAKANIEKNIENAKELFQSKLNVIFSQKGEGADWVLTELGKLGIITSSKRIYKSDYVTEGIPFYRTKEIKELSNGKNITLELFISEQKYIEIKNRFGVPQIGDILISAVGTIGEIMVIENDNEFYFKDGNIIWLKDFKNVNPNYLRYLLKSFVEKIKSLAIGSAYSALTIEKLNLYKVVFPSSMENQQKIVNDLDELSLQTKLIQDKYKQKLANLEELKKSILEKAFKGELI